MSEPSAAVRVAVPLSLYSESIVQMALLALEPDFEVVALTRDADHLLVKLAAPNIGLSAEQITRALMRQLLITTVQRRVRAEGAELAELFASSAGSISLSGRKSISQIAESGPTPEPESNTPIMESTESILFPGCRLLLRDPASGNAHYALNNRRFTLTTILHIAESLRLMGSVLVIPFHRSYEVRLSARVSDQLPAMEAQLFRDLEGAMLGGMPDAAEAE